MKLFRILAVLTFVVSGLFTSLAPQTASAVSAEDACQSSFNPGSGDYAQCIIDFEEELAACDRNNDPGTGTWITCREAVFDKYDISRNDGASGGSTPLPGFSIAKQSCDVDGSVLGIPTWYKYLPGEQDLTIFEGSNPSPGKCVPVLERNSEGEVDVMSFLSIGLAVLEAIMVIAGFVAVVMIFWGSFMFITSQGESDKAAGARKTVINATIGLVIVIVATQVVSFIARSLTS